MTTSKLTPQSTSSDAPPPQLLEPCYQNHLRVVGRVLDEHSLDQAVVLEILNGFMLRAYDPNSGEHVSETFTNESLMQTLRVAIYSRGAAGTGHYRSPLRPTGYEDFLRALGYRLDQRRAEAVVIVECSRYFHVSGHERIGDDFQAPLSPFVDLYEVPGINRLVNEAIARRTGELTIGGMAIRNVDPDLPVRIIRPGSRR